MVAVVDGTVLNVGFQFVLTYMLGTLYPAPRLTMTEIGGELSNVRS
jgi:hypothetical protein